MTSAIKWRRGITFIELLIVIVIIGVLSTVSIPRFRNTFSSLELENFTKEIYYLSRYLQSSAISQEKIFYLGLNRDEEKAQFQAYYVTQESTLEKIKGRFSGVYETPRGISISSITPEETQGVYFYPDSSADNAIICFQNSNQQKFCLSIKGATIAIKKE
ncbi:MAG: prepilin-type N-terminal cleavage/methylation domain-containing protein [Candidatus Omnitrophota bacterium]